MSTSDNLWNVVTLHPKPTEGQDALDAYHPQQDRSQPDLKAGFRIWSTERAQVPQPSWFYTESANRLQDFGNYDPKLQNTFMVFKVPTAEEGAIQQLNMISTRNVRQLADGNPLGPQHQDLGIVPYVKGQPRFRRDFPSAQPQAADNDKSRSTRNDVDPDFAEDDVSEGGRSGKHSDKHSSYKKFLNKTAMGAAYGATPAAGVGGGGGGGGGGGLPPIPAFAGKKTPFVRDSGRRRAGSFGSLMESKDAEKSKADEYKSTIASFRDTTKPLARADGMSLLVGSLKDYLGLSAAKPEKLSPGRASTPFGTKQTSEDTLAVLQHLFTQTDPADVYTAPAVSSPSAIKSPMMLSAIDATIKDGGIVIPLKSTDSNSYEHIQKVHLKNTAHVLTFTVPLTNANPNFKGKALGDLDEYQVSHDFMTNLLSTEEKVLGESTDMSTIYKSSLYTMDPNDAVSNHDPRRTFIALASRGSEFATSMLTQSADLILKNTAGLLFQEFYDGKKISHTDFVQVLNRMMIVYSALETDFAQANYTDMNDILTAKLNLAKIGANNILAALGTYNAYSNSNNAEIGEVNNFINYFNFKDSITNYTQFAPFVPTDDEDVLGPQFEQTMKLPRPKVVPEYDEYLLEVTKTRKPSYIKRLALLRTEDTINMLNTADPYDVYSAMTRLLPSYVSLSKPTSTSSLKGFSGTAAGNDSYDGYAYLVDGRSQIISSSRIIPSSTNWKAAGRQKNSKMANTFTAIKEDLKSAVPAAKWGAAQLLSSYMSLQQAKAMNNVAILTGTISSLPATATAGVAAGATVGGLIGGAAASFLGPIVGFLGAVAGTVGAGYMAYKGNNAAMNTVLNKFPGDAVVNELAGDPKSPLKGIAKGVRTWLDSISGGHGGKLAVGTMGVAGVYVLGRYFLSDEGMENIEQKIDAIDPKMMPALKSGIEYTPNPDVVEQLQKTFALENADAMLDPTLLERFLEKTPELRKQVLDLIQGQTLMNQVPNVPSRDELLEGAVSDKIKTTGLALPVKKIKSFYRDAGSTYVDALAVETKDFSESGILKFMGLKDMGEYVRAGYGGRLDLLNSSMLKFLTEGGGFTLPTGFQAAFVERLEFQLASQIQYAKSPTVYFSDAVKILFETVNRAL